MSECFSRLAYDILSILGCVRWKNLNGNPLSFSSNIELKSVKSKSEQSNVGSSASGEGDLPADFSGDNIAIAGHASPPLSVPRSLCLMS